VTTLYLLNSPTAASAGLILKSIMSLLHVACVVGARPNFIKMAALIEEARRRPGVAATLIHTGQHFSPEMSQALFDDLELPAPDRHLGAGGGTQAEQTAEIMVRLERVFTETRPDLVLVVGDVNSTLAAALVASKMAIPIAHVEAGLRSRDRAMPEEINRLVTDVLADYLFVTEPSGVENLRAEGIPAGRVFFTGNVMIDTLLRFREKAARSDVLGRLGVAEKSYALVTLHRPSNVDSAERLTEMAAALRSIGESLPVVFPAHPRTRANLEKFAIACDGLILTPPLGYLDFLKLMASARLVLTDSGGIQEETTILQVPCLTLRENTERPVTIATGTNRLAGTAPAKIVAAAREALDAPAATSRVPELWDGRAAARIWDALEKQAARP
jgi:UDP-N-acetylglucosamine 2-epimerase (non-hydrolysing)